MSNSPTELLRQVALGDEEALNVLLPLMMAELRGIAAARLRRDRHQYSLQPTELVNEAYQKFARQDERVANDRGHFLAIAARAMRQILIDRARRRRAQKRISTPIALTDPDVLRGPVRHPIDVLVFDEVLQRLSALSERRAKVVDLKVYGGLTHQDIAETLGISVSTARREWETARAWLKKELQSN